MDLRTVSPVGDTKSGGVPWGPHTVAIGIIAFVGVFVASGVLLAVIAVASGAVSEVEFSATALLTATLVLQLGTLGVAYYFGPYRHGVTWTALGFRWLSRGRLVAWAAIALFGGILTGLIYITLTEAIAPALSPPDLSDDLGLGGDAPLATLLYAWVTVGVVAPIVEEAFDRGFVFGGLAAHWGPWPAILVSAAVFSVAHLTPGLMLPAFVTGVIFAWVYWRSGSIWPVVTAHMTQNSLAFIGSVLA